MGRHAAEQARHERDSAMAMMAGVLNVWWWRAQSSPALFSPASVQAGWHKLRVHLRRIVASNEFITSPLSNQQAVRMCHQTMLVKIPAVVGEVTHDVDLIETAIYG